MGKYELSWKAPGPVASEFVNHRPVGCVSDDPDEPLLLPIDVLWGPVGSGKSVTCAIRIFLHSLQQPAHPGDGWRRSRWAVIRNTNPELETTTIKTWLEWFPEEVFGKFDWSPPYTHRIVMPELKLDMEVIFLPLDSVGAMKKLLSLELTGAWVNEAREIPREIVIAARSRCGRYPSLRSGVAAGWAGVICDTNAPEDELHYLPMWAGLTTPPEWMDPATVRMMSKPASVRIFIQPPGLLAERDKEGRVLGFKPNPDAENVKFLRRGYYMAQLDGNDVGWVLNMCCCEVRRSGETRLIYPDFNATLHVAPGPIEFVPQDRRGTALLLGMDFARNPALVVAQEHEGQLRILREFIGTNIDVAEFVKNVAAPPLRVDFGDHPRRGWGDPSGGNRTGADDTTAFSHAREGGIQLVKAPSNDPDARQRAVTRRLTALAGGKPAFLIDPRCRTLIGGFKGGYFLKRKIVPGTVAQYNEDPEKNHFSHPHDGLQYLVLGFDGANAGGADRQRQQREEAARMGLAANGGGRLDPFALSRAARGGGGAGRTRPSFGRSR